MKNCKNKSSLGICGLAFRRASRWFLGFGYQLKRANGFLCVAAGLILVFAGICFGMDPEAGTSGATFMKLGAGSARAQALGRAYVAVADGPEALVWNPAGIASSQLRELHFSYLGWLQDYSAKYLGYVHPLGQTVVGANIAYMDVSGFDVRDVNGVPLSNEAVRAYAGFGTFSLAKAFLVERLLLGASLKGVIENNDGTKYNTMVFDFGALLKVGSRLSFGWASQNLGADETKVVQYQRLGAAYIMNSFMMISVESEVPSDNQARFNMGAEITIPEQVLDIGRMAFRVGYFSSDSCGKSYDGFLKSLNMDKTTGVSLGFGLYTSEIYGYGMALDYALIPYGALGKSNQISLRFQF